MTEKLFALNVPEANLTDFNKRFASLEAKAMRFGGRLTKEVVSVTSDKRPDGYVDLTHTIVIEGDLPKIHGWDFIARIDHNIDFSGGSNLVYVRPSETMPEEYRTAAANCDHCNMQRKRKDTYILRNSATGEYKQIGRTCIRDFIGIDPEQMLKSFEFLKTLHEIGTGLKSDPVNRRMLDLVEYLSYTSAAIRLYGWTSKSAAQANESLMSTRDRAINAMFQTQSKYTPDFTPEAIDVQHAEDAIQYTRNLTGNNDFEHNIITIAKSVAVDWKATSLASAIMFAFFKANNLYQKVNTNNFAASEWWSAIGKREVFVGEVVDKKQVPATYTRNEFTITKMWNGYNLICFFTNIPYEIGETVRIKGKVIKQDEFKGVKQTILNRIKVVD